MGGLGDASSGTVDMGNVQYATKRSVREQYHEFIYWTFDGTSGAIDKWAAANHLQHFALSGHAYLPIALTLACGVRKCAALCFVFRIFMFA